MKAITYYSIYPLLWCISKLSFKNLYRVSNGLRFVLYRVVGYRKQVVKENLLLCFPEKSDEERLAIEQKFYTHLCDLFLEMIKTMSMTNDDIRERFVVKNPEYFKHLENSNQSAIFMFGHYASYEWSMAAQLHTDIIIYGIYKRLRNPYFDKLVRGIRSKFGAGLIDKNEVTRQVAKNKIANKIAHYGMVADQSPKATSNAHLGSFMGIESAMFVGSEIMAKRTHFPVYYYQIEKTKRGYYTAEVIPLSENPSDVPNFQITDAFFKLLEKQIHKAPEYYFWTHKRWKHKKDKVQAS